MMTLSNVLAYFAQVALLVLACAGLPRALRLRAPAVQYAFWRVVLLVCLALPLIQPWRPVTATFEGFALGTVTPSSVPFVNKITTEPSRPPIYALAFNPLFVGAIVLAAGCALRLLWIVVGIARLRSLRRAPATEPAEGFDDLLSVIGVTVPILWSPRVRHPVTFGLRRPVILLPVALKSVDPGAQRAVVAHELHHVARRDWAWLLAEEVLRAVFWFHPAMWWLISRIQLARETVVDELSILVTNARRTYLDALLAFADDTGLGSPAFSARRHLFHRVMLLSKEGEMSSLRVAIGSGVLLVALSAGTWSAAYAFPLYTEILAQQQASPSDQPQVQPPPPPPPPTVTRVTKGGKIMQGPPPPPPPAPPMVVDVMPESFARAMAELHPIRIGGAIKSPERIHNVMPVYPAEARANGIEGVVIVETIVGIDGSVADARVLRTTPALDQAALDAVRQWRFAQTIVDGEPRAALLTITVSFRIQ
jgi:TonB family protein